MSLFGPVYDQAERAWLEPPDEPEVIEIAPEELYRRHNLHYQCTCPDCESHRQRLAEQAQDEYFAHQEGGPCDCQACRCYLESLR